MQPAGQTVITAFLAKLWALVNDTSCDDLITWGPSGGSFHVYDQARFSREILPRYFKHNNFASFIRQLNMYGFRKISNIEHGSLKNEHDDIEFAHPHFIRGQEALLELIKRRAPENQLKPNALGGEHCSSNRVDCTAVVFIPGSTLSSALLSANYIDAKTGQPIELTHVLENVKTIQSRQNSLSDKLSYMQSENQALWGEIGSLRQKHAKQQQIVSKLMEFLLHFVASQSSHPHEQSVDQQASNEALTHALFSQQQQQDPAKPSPMPQDAKPTSFVPNESNALKRKQEALMHGDESSKRVHLQQPTNFGRQQSVTINELTDNDASAWAHHGTTLPLIDLVPSPPPSNQEQSTNESLHVRSQNPMFRSTGNGDNGANAYVPDFLLCDDAQQRDPATNLRQANGTNNSGSIRTVTIDADCFINII